MMNQKHIATIYDEARHEINSIKASLRVLGNDSPYMSPTISGSETGDNGKISVVDFLGGKAVVMAENTGDLAEKLAELNSQFKVLRSKTHVQREKFEKLKDQYLPLEQVRFNYLNT